MTITNYPFTEQESQAAHDGWGANCGPNALAFALNVKLDDVRPAIPDFAKKGYTNPTMMKDALAYFGKSFKSDLLDVPGMCSSFAMSLVRIQWTGPWTDPGANPRWAYGHTHWIAAWRDGKRDMVFDCNGGVMELFKWVRDIVPILLPKRGLDWKPTHVWRIQ